MSSAVLQRAAIKLWRHLVPRFGLSVGNSHVRVSGNNLKPAALLRWEFGWKTELLSRLLRPPAGDFIDVGANVGQTLLDFCAAGTDARYVGFEPNPHAFASLSTLIDDNRFSRCAVLPLALSDNFGIANLYLSPAVTTDSAASVVADLRPRKDVRALPITLCRFDDIYDDLHVRSIGLVKIDVEGAELDVLRGMSTSLMNFRPPIIIEVLYADANADIRTYEENLIGIAAFLESSSYAILRILKDAHDQFVGLSPIDRFPIQVWTRDNANECDYLLIPRESLQRFLGLLGPVGGIASKR